MLASCAPRCSINWKASPSSRQQAPRPQRCASPAKLALPALAAGLVAAQLTLLPAPALALEGGAAEQPALHTECIARRHARAAAACVATLAGQPPAVLDLQGEEGGEPSKAQIAAERRARLQATAAQLTMTLAGVMDGAAPGADAAFKALMGGM